MSLRIGAPKQYILRLYPWNPLGIRLGVGPERESHVSDNFFHADGLMGLAEGLGPEPKLGQEPADAASVIVDAVDRFEDLTIVAVGPLTNLAAAERRKPGTLRRARDILVMGGGFAKGNVKPWAEFNFWCDADAAHEVFRSAAHAVVFPLDVTERLCFRSEHVDRMGAPGPRAEWMRAALVKYAAQAEEWKNRCVFIHDPFPVAFLLRPSTFRLERVGLDVEGDASPEAGRSRLVPGGLANAWRPLDVDEALFDTYMCMHIYI